MSADSIEAVPRLYISDITVPQSTGLMKHYGFTHVVSLTNARHRPQFGSNEGIEQLWVDIEDDPLEDILLCLDGVCTWIEDALEQDNSSRLSMQARSDDHGDDKGDDRELREGKSQELEMQSAAVGGIEASKVLIHCIQGISRSGAVLVAYLMRSQRLSFESALKMAQNARATVAPNSGFADQIRLWQQLQYTIHSWGEDAVEGSSLKDEYLSWKNNRGVLLSRRQEDQQKNLLLKMQGILMKSQLGKQKRSNNGCK